jgi:hypothetical protein
MYPIDSSALSPTRRVDTGLKRDPAAKSTASGKSSPGVRAEQPEDAARLDAKIDAAQRLDVAVALVQTAGLDGWIGRHASTLAVGSRHVLQADDSPDPVESPLERVVERLRVPNARL